MSTESDQTTDESAENEGFEDVASDRDPVSYVEDREPRHLNVGEGTNDVGSTTYMRLGEVLKDSISADFTSSISRIMAQTAAALPPPSIDYKFLADSASHSLRTSVLNSGLADALGRSIAERAAFNITSGLQISDSFSSLVAGLAMDTGGLRLTAKALGTSNLGLAASSALSEIVKGMDASGIALSRSVAMQELVTTSGIANLLGSDKMMASWRQSLLTEATARSLIGTIAVSDVRSSVLRDIVGTNAATARVVGLFAAQNKGLMLAPAISARPTRELRALLAGLPSAPDSGVLDFASQASRGIAGITAADLILTGGTIDTEAVELLEAEVVEPWVSGVDTSRQVLFVRLGTLNPDVPDLLRGAWHQVEANGPAAASMASHAAQEVIDRTLRAVAPDELVMRLDAAGRLPKDSTYEKEGKLRPTRVGRIAAALHERHPREAKVVAAQAKALAVSVSYLSENFQAGKHGSSGSVGLVRTYLVSAEAFLTQLLYEPGDG